MPFTVNSCALRNAYLAVVPQLKYKLGGLELACMSHLTVPQILKLDWGDAELSAVRWDERGRDLALTFERTDSNIELRCSWADGLKLDLENRNRGGRFLTWSGLIEPQPDGRYRVRFDFGSAGQLSLICNDVMVVLSSAAT